MECRKVEYYKLPDLSQQPLNMNDTCYRYEDDWKTWLVTDEKLGGGVYGVVRLACADRVSNETCQYVAKEIEFYENNKDKRYRNKFYWNHFIGESLMTKYAGEHGFGVPFYGYFLCDKGRKGVMFQARYDNNIRMRVRTVNGRRVIKGVQLTMSDIVQLVGHIRCMHRAGILHLDLFAKNVAYKDMPDGTRRIRIIDFGLAIPFGQQIPPALRAIDYINIASSIPVPAYQAYILDVSKKANGVTAHREAEEWLATRKDACSSQYFLLNALPEHLFRNYGPAVTDLLAWASRCGRGHNKMIVRQIGRELRKRNLPTQ